MQFYKNIVGGLKKIFDDLIKEDSSVAQETVYHSISDKFKSFSKMAKVADDAKFADEKHAVSNSKDNNSLLEFVAFISPFQSIENERVKQKVFDYLSVNGFPGLNVGQANRKDFLVALLEGFLKQQEIGLDQVQDWIKHCDKDLISTLNAAFAKIILDPRLHNKSIKDVKKVLFNLNYQKLITEEQLLSWLIENDKEGLVEYINNRPKIFEPAKLLSLLTLLVDHNAALKNSMDGKKLLLHRMLELKNLGIATSKIQSWITLNDEKQQLAAVYQSNTPKFKV